MSSHQGEKVEKVLHDLSWGMCFCGSYLNGSVVADAINEILSSLEVEDQTPIDGKAIINIGFDIFKEISDHLIGLHQKAGFSRVMMGGFCPATREVAIYHLNWKYADGGVGIDYTLSQETFDPPFVAIGDSDAVALAKGLSGKVNYAQVPGYTEYHLLKDVIENKNIAGVGGAIQTGHFVNGVFRIYGMVTPYTFR